MSTEEGIELWSHYIVHLKHFNVKTVMLIILELRKGILKILMKKFREYVFKYFKDSGKNIFFFKYMKFLFHCDVINSTLCHKMLFFRI